MKHEMECEQCEGDEGRVKDKCSRFKRGIFGAQRLSRRP